MQGCNEFSQFVHVQAKLTSRFYCMNLIEEFQEFAFSADAMDNEVEKLFSDSDRKDLHNVEVHITFSQGTN